MVQKFLYELGHETGLAIYGEEDVRKIIASGIVEVLLLSEKLNTLHVKVSCKNCNYHKDELLEPHKVLNFEKQLLETKCPNCSNLTLVVEESKDLLSEFLDMAEKSNTKVEIISPEIEEGVMLEESFGGIAAILRYKA